MCELLKIGLSGILIIFLWFVGLFLIFNVAYPLDWL